MNTYDELEKDVIEKLKTSGLIEKFSYDEIGVNPNIEIIIELFKRTLEIYSDDNGVYYLTDNGNTKNYCPESKRYSIISQGEWLCDKIPSVPFDIDQSGNVRKADEAEALFCACVVSNILKDSIFRAEITNLASSYDFSDMKNLKDENFGFRALFNSWESLQSTIINVVISACRYRISNFKKDTDQFLKDGIQETELIKLRSLQLVIRNINYKYQEDYFSTPEFKRMNRADKLQLIY